MRFEAVHRFGAAPDAVAAVLADPGFYRSLRLPDVGTPEVVSHDGVADGVARLRLRYEFTGSLDPLARRLLGGRRLAWIQDVHVEGRGGRLEFFAEAAPKRLRGSARFDLVAEPGVTRRQLDGELVVAVPALGRAAEPRIVPGLVRRLDLEAEALARRLEG